jgi:enterochelin esterase-like enzyme
VAFRSVTVTPLVQGRADVHDVAYPSKLHGREITVKVYLPPGYEGAARRYPVVYNLHGAGGGSPERQWDRMRSTLRDAMENGKVEPRIYVFVQGLGDTFFLGDVERSIVEELIPFVDRRYRTVATRGGRSVDGFSMGGFGALLLALKHPALFQGVVAYGAALVEQPRLAADHPNVWVEKNVRALAGMKIRLVCGDADSLYPRNVAFVERARQLGLTVDWVSVPGVGHDTKGLYQRVGVESLRFLQ